MIQPNDLLLLLPTNVRDIKDFKYFMISLNDIIKDLYNNLNDIELQYNIDTANETTILMWEQLYNIRSKANESLDIRRFRIKNRFKENIPLTKWSLKYYLDSIVGDGNYILDERYSEYKLNIHIELASKKKLQDVREFLIRNIPANIVINIYLLYNTHFDLKEVTNNYLSTITHKGIKEDALYDYNW